jgi:hypothetical protein
MQQSNQLAELMEYSTTLTSQIIGLNSKIIEFICLQQDSASENWISVKEASQLLGITPSGVRYQIKCNLIRSKRKGEKILLVSKSDVLAMHK